MVKVYQTPQATLVVRTKGTKPAKSPLVGAGKRAGKANGKRAKPARKNANRKKPARNRGY